MYLSIGAGVNLIYVNGRGICVLLGVGFQLEGFSEIQNIFN